MYIGSMVKNKINHSNIDIEEYRTGKKISKKPKNLQNQQKNNQIQHSLNAPESTNLAEQSTGKNKTKADYPTHLKQNQILGSEIIINKQRITNREGILMDFSDLAMLYFYYTKNGIKFKASISSAGMTADKIVIYPNQHAIVFNVDSLMIYPQNKQSADGWAEGKVNYKEDISIFIRELEKIHYFSQSKFVKNLKKTDRLSEGSNRPKYVNECRLYYDVPCFTQFEDENAKEQERQKLLGEEQNSQSNQYEQLDGKVGKRKMKTQKKPHQKSGPRAIQEEDEEEDEEDDDEYYDEQYNYEGLEEQQEVYDEDRPVSFPALTTAEEIEKSQKIKYHIKSMPHQDKLTVITEIFKIKKKFVEKLNPLKKFKCPIFSCQKEYKQVHQLRNHLKNKHPELAKNGIEMNEVNGSFTYRQAALDLTLYLGKMYPRELKKIIKMTKTRQIASIEQLSEQQDQSQ